MRAPCGPGLKFPKIIELYQLDYLDSYRLLGEKLIPTFGTLELFQLGRGVMVLIIYWIQFRLLISLYTTHGIWFFPNEKYLDLRHLKITWEALEQVDGLVHVSNSKDWHLDCFALIINPCFSKTKSGLFEEIPTFKYSLAKGRGSSLVRSLPSYHCQTCTKSHLRQVIHIPEMLVFTDGWGRFYIWGSVAEHNFDPISGGLMVFDERGLQTMPLTYFARIKFQNSVPFLQLEHYSNMILPDVCTPLDLRK